MTTYIYNGHTAEQLDRLVNKTLEALDSNDNHLILKNGDDIEVYANGNDWTIIDTPQHGGKIYKFIHRYDAVLTIKKMARR